jgi:hypothetical protein
MPRGVALRDEGADEMLLLHRCELLGACALRRVLRAGAGDLCCGACRTPVQGLGTCAAVTMRGAESWRAGIHAVLPVRVVGVTAVAACPAGIVDLAMTADGAGVARGVVAPSRAPFRASCAIAGSQRVAQKERGDTGQEGWLLSLPVGMSEAGIVLVDGGL